MWTHGRVRLRPHSYPPTLDTLVVAISATGRSVETLATVEPYDNLVALTNTVDSVLARRAEVVVPMLAGPGRSGVACRTFQHTLAMVRESPRRPADACETGDWSHLDVYPTKTRDYRTPLLPGSR